MNKEIEEFLKTLPPERQEKLRQFQWKLDQDLNKFKDPTARFNRMVEIFWEQVQVFKQSLEDPSSLLPKEEEIPDNVIGIDKFKKD